jgi:hypothetical protein
MAPVPGPAVREALLLSQGHHLVAVVLWLAAASFAAGLVIGVAAQKRAALLAVVAVAACLGLMLTTGSRPVPAALYHPLIALGGFLILLAAAMGGWIGQHLWRGTKRPPPPPSVDRPREPC